MLINQGRVIRPSLSNLEFSILTLTPKVGPKVGTGGAIQKVKVLSSPWPQGSPSEVGESGSKLETLL